MLCARMCVNELCVPDSVMGGKGVHVKVVYVTSLCAFEKQCCASQCYI